MRRPVAWLVCLLGVSTVAPAPGAPPWSVKVDPWVMERTAKGEAEFLVVLTEQPDLSAANRLPTKAAKGRYVFEQLSAAAQRSQKPVTVVLDRLGVKYRPLWIANMIWVRGPRAAVETMARRPDVARISANPAVRHLPPILRTEALAPLTPAGIEWNVSQIHASDVWGLGYDGQGVVVAGQDTGYQWNHPALINAYRGWDGTNSNHSYNWHDAIHTNDVHNSGPNPCGYDLTVPCDDDSHGTHTMGTMIGDDGVVNQIGVAPGARWIGCRNMERGWGTPTTYAECYQWFIAPTDSFGLNLNPDLAPDVINNSWTCPTDEGCTDPTVLQTIVQNTRAAGIVVVASAGNEGSSCSSITDPSAIYEATFTVGSTDSSDNIAGTSGRGPVTVDGSNRLKPNISAPGVSVRSAIPTNTYGTKSGTSMAGPHIAGIVALVISAHPSLRGQVEKIETLIEQTAVPRTTTQSCGSISGSEIPNNTYGWGRADALAALALDDTDSDEMPDWWEITEGFNKNDAADAALDADGDGNTNLEEFKAGTNPHDNASALQVIRIESTNSVVTIEFTTVAGKAYRLERSTAPGTNDWFTVTNNVPGTGSPLQVTDPNATNTPTLFYRVLVLP